MGKRFAAEFGEVGVEMIECGALDGLTIKELKQLLKDTVWQRVKAVWRGKAKESSKLEMTEKLMYNECKALV